MDAKQIADSITSCILDHFEFCTDHASAARCAASEITVGLRRGHYGPCSLNVEAGLERCAELLHCEPTFSAIAVAIEDLIGQVDRSKKMIAKLHYRVACDDYE